MLASCDRLFSTFKAGLEVGSHAERVAGSEHIYIWIVLQRIIIPVIIFFRFHSLVMLVECWKNTYRREEAKRFETTISRGQSRVDVGGWRGMVSIRRNHDDNNGQ